MIVLVRAVGFDTATDEDPERFGATGGEARQQSERDQ